MRDSDQELQRPAKHSSPGTLILFCDFSRLFVAIPFLRKPAKSVDHPLNGNLISTIKPPSFAFDALIMP